MRRLILWTILGAGLVLLSVPAFAQPPSGSQVGAFNRSAYENVIIGEAFGFETITLTGAAKTLTAAKIDPADTATKGYATSAILTINTASTTVCFEGTTATANVCHAFPATSSFMVYGTKTLRLMSLFSAGSTVTVTYFRQKGK